MQEVPKKLASFIRNKKNLKYIVVIFVLIITAPLTTLTWLKNRDMNSDLAVTIEELYTALNSSVDEDLLNSLGEKQNFDELNDWFEEVEDVINPNILASLDYENIPITRPIVSGTHYLGLRIIPLSLDSGVKFEVRALSKTKEALRISPFTDDKVVAAESALAISEDERKYYDNQIELYSNLALNTLDLRFNQKKANLQSTVDRCNEILSAEDLTGMVHPDSQERVLSSCTDEVNIYSLVLDDQYTEDDVINSDALANSVGDAFTQLAIDSSIQSYYELKNTRDKYLEADTTSNPDVNLDIYSNNRLRFMDHYRAILKHGAYLNNPQSFMQKCNTFTPFLGEHSSDYSPPYSSQSVSC